MASTKRRQPSGNVYLPGCPSRSILDTVTSRWGALILILLLKEGPLRFSELARAIGGVSEKMLAQSLQALEKDGFLLRTVYPTIPPKVDYRLTALGQDLAPCVKSLASWVEAHVGDVMEHRKRHQTKASS
ncbi:HxlR family transcriptional regulator [Bryobacterales bacterium F-183]|nr:HxlR family transcriptional regulator [Bryobacterales bacterium F-183]